MDKPPREQASPPRHLFDLAFAEAEAARDAGEVPVGAIIAAPASAGAWAVLARERNRIVELQDPTAHAELLAIRTACRAAKSERLPDAHLFTTLEPCVMCSGAILFARLAAVHFCARTESGIGLADVLAWKPERLKGINHTVILHEHTDLKARSADLLRAFFAARRDVSQDSR